MLAFPEMIAPAAKEAGMKVPDDLEDFDSEEYPHWQVFCRVQLGAPMPHASAHWENAKVVAQVPYDQIMQITYEDLVDLGLAIGFSH